MSLSQSKVCCVFNLAPHYRAPIYSLMDEHLNCDFYIGDTLNNQIKLMDYHSLTGFKGILKNKEITNYGFMWQKGAWKLVFKPYKHYIITGSPGLLSNWVLLILAKLLGKKTYAWTHGMKKPAKSKGEIFQKMFYKLCYRVMPYGDLAKKTMIEDGFDEGKLVPIYNSLDYQKQIEIRKKLKKTKIFSTYFKNNYPNLIYIGRLQKSKKLNHLVSALEKLVSSNINCNLVLVGSEMKKNEISNLIDAKKLTKNVWLYGPSYDENEIGNLLYNADVCVSPGPVGLTALHALTYGCPVISNNDFVQQMPEHEVINSGINGDFFINDDVEDLVKVILNWINLDQKKRETVRTASYKIIDEKWNPINQIEILKKTIKAK